MAERFRGRRLGEGAIGLVLWNWQKSRVDEIYVTVFEKQELLINQLKRFGFQLFGNNLNGECVYMKSRKNIDYSDPCKAFPFINPSFKKAGYLIVDDKYHDTLFPYSELKNTIQEQVAISVANGVRKIYIGTPSNIPPYQVGEPILVYRKYTGTHGGKGFKSCITSYCVITKKLIAKSNGVFNVKFDEIIKLIGNKSVFNKEEIYNKYSNQPTLIIIEMLYLGFFGAGNNVNWSWLKNNGYWDNKYPTSIPIYPEQFKALLKEGKIDVSNVIID